MERTYTMSGDYLLPDLTLPQAPALGKYEMLRRTYLKQHKPGLYAAWSLSGKLGTHLTETDQAAKARMELLTCRMAQAEGATEELKAADQMAWVGLMNNIRQRAEETVLTELIYS